MRFLTIAKWSMLLLCLSGSLAAQEAYKTEELKAAPPSAFSPEISSVLLAQGYRVTDGQGKAFVDLWLRKSIPASSRPSGAKGVIQFPFLAEGELVGVAQLHSEAHDYRNQAIAKGLYTLRYGHQPVNGDHLGVSPFGDYLLLLPVTKDKSLASLPRKQLETQSRDHRLESSGCSLHARRAGVCDGADALDDSRRGEEHLAGRRSAQPLGSGTVEVDRLSRLDRCGWCVRGCLRVSKFEQARRGTTLSTPCRSLC